VSLSAEGFRADVFFRLVQLTLIPSAFVVVALVPSFDFVCAFFRQDLCCTLLPGTNSEHESTTNPYCLGKPGLHNLLKYILFSSMTT
jgi:hypothetical protein